MPISGEELFWELVEPMYADPAVHRSSMMGLPCVRLHGRFFASLDRRSGALLVKLPAQRVGQLIAAGHGEPFAPAGRTFREWVALPRPDRRRWRSLLAEARDHAAGTGSGSDIATRVADLDRHVAALEANGVELSDPTCRRLPAGFDPAGPAARFAVRDGFHLVRRYPHPPEVTTAALVGWCAQRLAPFALVHRWLTRTG
jgi:hypothetical protein